MKHLETLLRFLTSQDKIWENHPKKKEPFLMFAVTSDSSESQSDIEDEDQGRKSKSKKLKWLKRKLDPERDLKITILDLELAKECLQPSDTLLKVFQNKKLMIHVLKPTLLQFTKDSLLEIIPSKYLKRSDVKPLGGRSLKDLQLETVEDKISRRSADKDIEKEVNILEQRELQLEAEKEDAVNEKQKGACQ